MKHTSLAAALLVPFVVGLSAPALAETIDGSAIDGLYCIGNNSASVMGPSYPGAGSTLGPAMTFGLRAVAHMRGQPMALQHTDLLQLEV